MVKETVDRADEGRRSFLKLAAAAAPAAAVTAVVADPAEAAETAVEGSGLRKTAHVQAYLNSARF